MSCSHTLMCASTSTTTGIAFFGGGVVYVGDVPNTRFKHGHVVARAIVLDANGLPTLVTYNEDGTEGQVVTPSGYDVTKIKILAAADYRLYEQQLELYKAQYADTLARDAELMSRQQFLQTSFKTADNKTVIPTPPLPEGINSVLVRGQNSRILPDPDQLILMRFSLDMSQPANVSDNSVSILVTEEGKVLSAYDKRVGYRTGFYGKPGAPIEPRYSRNIDRQSDEIFGPVPDIAVSVDHNIYPGGIGISDEEGKFGFVFHLPLCPPGGFEFNTDIWVELKYQTFMPTSSPVLPYFLRKYGLDYCYAALVPPHIAPSIIGILSTQSVPVVQNNIFIDVMFLTGSVTLQNRAGDPVSVGDHTEYTSFDEAAEKITQTHYDFNGDGENDTVIEGTLTTLQDDEGNEVKAFIPESLFSGGEEVDRQGLYFNADDASGLAQAPLDHQPDLIRIIDDEKRLEDTGLLNTLSASDYQNTDILFFRESTGQLVMERRGLRDEEIEGRRSALYDDQEERFVYQAMLRGPDDSNLNVGGGNYNKSFEEWSTDNQLTEPFQTKEGDYLRSGEYIKVVAINRATGYMGTARVQLDSASENAQQQDATNLTVEVPPITMRPPNLKVWAERDYSVEKGITKGEDRNYMIGNEGAGLTSDTTITIYTEWLDHDGSALPDELGQDDGERYGLTGRLAKIVGPNNLAAASISANGSDLAEFPIAPGRKVQAINVKSNLSTAEHYYVHVVGKAKDQECEAGATCPDFSKGQGAAEPFTHRPGLLTPILTPLFDEDTHWETYNKYREIKREQDPANSNDDDLQKPLPSYAWHYRPEYQFSQFELEMQAINRVQEDDNGQENKTNILDLDTPTVTSGDKLIEALYSLISNQNERLTPIDGEQELILALGEHEQLITIGEDQTIEFSNIDHLAQLDVEDYLSMRLYTNNDAGNVLWEYAFGAFGLVADMNQDGKILPRNKSDRINSNENPFRFWINDDNDQGEIAVGRKFDEDDIPGKTSGADYEDDVVDGMRDLVDFFPVFVDVKAALASFPISLYEYRLKIEGGGLKFFETTDLLPDSEDQEKRVDSIIKNVEVAKKYSDQELLEIPSGGIALSTPFLVNVEKGEGGIIFVESNKEIKDVALVLDIIEKRNQKSVSSKKLWLSISDVENMYRYVNVRSSVEQGDTEGLATRTAEPSNNPDDITEEKYFAFVHGYNVTAEKARGWNAEVFKRMYRLGFDGRFIGVNWAGDTNPDYHEAAYRAFESGQDLSNTINGIATGPLTIAAHSLGNMVVSNAIVDTGLSADRYYLINAAVAIEAYDRTQMEGDATMQQNMTEEDWYPYPEKLYAANWHKVFEGTTDLRKNLTWKDRFSDVLPIAYNFYSPGDDVVENARPNEEFGDIVWNSLVSGDLGRHAWVGQEIAKGGQFVGSCSPLTFSRCQAGWQFNNDDDDLKYIGKVVGYDDDLSEDVYSRLNA